MNKATETLLAILAGALLGLGLYELLEGRTTRTANGLERDARKLRGDWERVGDDIRNARRQHEQKANQAA